MKLGFRPHVIWFGRHGGLAVYHYKTRRHADDDAARFTARRESTFADKGKAFIASFSKQSDNQGQSDNQLVNVGAGDSLRGSGKMYSWRDSKGQMHFSEHPPEDASSANVAALPEDVNLMQSVKVPKTAGGSAGQAAQGQGGGFQLAFPSTIPVRDIPKLMNDAKGVQALADKRNAAASEI